MILYTLIGLIIIYLGGNVIQQLLRNIKGHKYFKERAKNLFVLPNPNLFTGHITQTFWNPKNYQLLQELHAKHGKTFGFYLCALPLVASTDLDLIKLIMVDQGDKHIDRMKLNGPYKEINVSIIQANGDKWRAARRAIAPSMTNHKVRSELISSDIEDVVGQLKGFLQLQERKAHARGEVGFEIDSYHTAKRFALAVIVLITYKRNHIVDFVNDRDKWVDELADIGPAAANPLCLLAMMFPILEPMNYHLIKLHKISKQFDKILNFINQLVDLTRNKQETDQVRRRLADEIIEAYLSKKLGVEALRGTLMIFFLAGFETTVGALNHMIWQLAWNQNIQDKLRKEILVEGFDSEYLHWCLYETMRIHPPIPIGFGRQLAEDVHYKGSVIPEGTFFAPSVYTVHHDPQIWPEPEKFKPERWASSSQDIHPAAWLAFGLGPRNCVGGKLALHEMKLMFQMLLTHYRIETCSRTPKEFNFISPSMLSTQMEDPTIVRLVPIQQAA